MAGLGSKNGISFKIPLDLPAMVPVHASQLYSRNITAFLTPLIKDGELKIDMADDVVGPWCVTHQGQWGESTRGRRRLLKVKLN